MEISFEFDGLLMSISMSLALNVDEVALLEVIESMLGLAGRLEDTCCLYHPWCLE